MVLVLLSLRTLLGMESHRDDVGCARMAEKGWAVKLYCVSWWRYSRLLFVFVEKGID